MLFASLPTGPASISGAGLKQKSGCAGPVGGKARSKKRFVEVFCGGAGLSAAVYAEGSETTAVDWRYNKQKPRTPVVIIDLRDEEG